MAASARPITIVGAGVIGLSTARILSRRHLKAPITIIAAELPRLPSQWTASDRPSADYASMWAGAHYRPIPRSTRQLEEEADLAMLTAEMMYEIADKSPEAGVARMMGVEYLENPSPEILELQTGDIYAGPQDSFRVLNENELSSGAAWGCEYQAWGVNVHLYCCWLVDLLQKSGVNFVQKRLSSIADAFTQPTGGSTTIVLNCSGNNFGQDPKMKQIRGQTVLVRNKYHSTVTRQNSDGSWSFLIPRPSDGGTVVGGTKEIGDTEADARPETRQKLLTEAVKAFPDFVDDISKFDVIMDNVGRRPWREGGMRIEVEEFLGDRQIVHGYGAGGRGYELSWGAATRIADMYDQALQNESRSTGS